MIYVATPINTPRKSIRVIAYILLVTTLISGCTHELDVRRQLHFRNDLKRLNTLILLYAQNHNNHLPLMKTKEQLIVALKPSFYVRYPHLNIEDQFSEPGEAVQCSWNQTLSGALITQLQPAGHIATFYGDRAYESGLREVVFLDGHAEQLSPDQFLRLKRNSQSYN